MSHSNRGVRQLFRPRAAWGAVLVALVLCGCTGARRAVGWSAIAGSWVRVPVHLRVQDVNERLDAGQQQALGAAEAAVRTPGFDGRTNWQEAVRGWKWVRTAQGLEWREQAGRTNQTPALRIDRGGDWATNETMVAVCFSGGGARAASLARHAMAELERQYNQAVRAGARAGDPPFRPLFANVDVYSSVSGGSIYASFLAESSRRAASGAASLTNVFARLGRGRRAVRVTRDLGFHAGVAYWSPFNLFVGPFMTTFTDTSYRDILSSTISTTDAAASLGAGFPFLARGARLGELPMAPRFFFNTTCQEAGLPFVFTQSAHVRREKGLIPDEPGVRFDLHHRECAAAGSNAPLRHAILAEDMNVNPGRIEIGDAVMASAAFPPVIDPLRLQTYDREGKPGGVLHLADGGVYDNSAMTMALDYFEYASSLPGSRLSRLVLVSVNAANSVYDLGEATSRNEQPFRLGYGYRDHALPRGFASLGLIHDLNTARVQARHSQRITELEECAKERGRTVSVVYFPVSLLQLSPMDPDRIVLTNGVAEAVAKIGTDLLISPEEDKALKRAVEGIVSAPQERGNWRSMPTGGGKVSLGEAFAQELMERQRAQAGRAAR